MKSWLKKQIEFLFGKLGFIPEKPIIGELRKVNVELENTTEEIKRWFDKPKIEPTRKRYKDEIWGDYWDEQYEPYYIAWYIRTISQHPKILQSLLHAISNYDWDDIVKFMNDVDWRWNDRKRSPNKEEMVDCVISLLHSCVHRDSGLSNFDGKNHGGVESGGFKVSIKNEEVIIDFDKKLHYNLY
jgi:hypothetical protein